MNATACAGWLLFAGVVGWAIWRRRETAETSAGILWWSAVAATLVAFRWKLLGVPHQFNPDEGQLIAGAVTLRFDPIFWRSVDGGTAGPLDFYPLLPAAWGDGPASFAIARAIGLGATWLTMYYIGTAVRFLAGPAWARFAVLPFLAFAAFTTSPDFVQLSTEVIPALLLAAGACAAVRVTRDFRLRDLWAAGLLLGSVPWAKFQGLPLAGTALVLLAIALIRSGRARLCPVLICASLVPSLACVSAVVSAGEWRNFFVPYILRNLNYIQEAPLPWAARVALQTQNALLDGFLGLWLAGTAALALVAGILFLVDRAAFRSGPGWTVTTAALVGVSLATVCVPSRPSMHHLWLVIPAVSWFATLCAATAGTPRGSMVACFLALCVAPQVGWRLHIGSGFEPALEQPVTPAHRQLTAVVRELVPPGESLGIWGWRCSLYVETGRRQATRQAQSEAQIYENAQQGYFLHRYLDDIVAARPVVFADAVGPGNFAFTDRRRAHEAFAPLRAWIDENYTLVADVDGTRVYLRNDRAAAELARAHAG